MPIDSTQHNQISMNCVSVMSSVSVTVLLMLCSGCDCSSVLNITAEVGDKVVLSCSCPPDQPPVFIWQKVVGTDEEVVNLYGTKEAVTKQYQNRTHLNVQRGNCSLVFSSVRLSDEGRYKCYYQQKPLQYEEINLKVTDIDSSTVCNHTDGVYCCQVTQLYPEGQILCRLNGQLQQLSVQCTKDHNTGLCDGSITLNGTASTTLTCEVTSAGINNKVICKEVPVTQNAVMTSSVCGVLAFLLVILVVFVGITCKNKHMNKRCIATSGRPV